MIPVAGATGFIGFEVVRQLAAAVLTGTPATLDAAVAFRWRHPLFDWT